MSMWDLVWKHHKHGIPYECDSVYNWAITNMMMEQIVEITDKLNIARICI